MQEFLGTDKQVNKTDPVVSVCVVTYNHKHFIEQCIDGILNQKTNFPFELIIGEDDSKDGTRELCINYAEKYPDKRSKKYLELASSLELEDNPVIVFWKVTD